MNTFYIKKRENGQVVNNNLSNKWKPCKNTRTESKKQKKIIVHLCYKRLLTNCLYMFFSVSDLHTVPSSPFNHIQDMNSVCLLSENTSTFDTLLLSLPRPPMTYGTFQGGAHLILEAWGIAHHRFEIDQSLSKVAQHLPYRPSATDFSGPLEQAPRSPLSQFPVGILVADHSRNSHETSLPIWYTWLTRCDTHHLPTAIVQV